MKHRIDIHLAWNLWAKTWPGLVIPQRNPLQYNDDGNARGDAS